MVEWLQVWIRGFIKDGVINGTLINTYSITTVHKQLNNIAVTFLNFVGNVSLLVGYCCWNSVLAAVHWQGLSVGYESNDNRPRIEEIVEWMVLHSDRKYLHWRLLPAIINFLSQNDEVSYHNLQQKNLDIYYLVQHM